VTLLAWQQNKIKQALHDHLPIRTVAKMLGISHTTVQKYKNTLETEVLCACGRPSSHKGICFERRKPTHKPRGKTAMKEEKRTEQQKVVLSEADQIAIFIATRGVTRLPGALTEEMKSLSPLEYDPKSRKLTRRSTNL
jgi:transposase